MTIRLLDFFTEQCAPCTAQDPIIAELETEWDAVDFQRINAEQSHEIANAYHVRSFPTIIVENDDGIVDRFVGLTQADDIEAALAEATA